jgi:pimeloyl-ACP methyl ester carboxylesterase
VSRHGRSRRGVPMVGAWLALAAAVLGAIVPHALAESLVLRDGRVIEGTLGTVGGLAENPLAPNKTTAPVVKTILLVDDNLRRTFVPKSQVTKLLEGADKLSAPVVKIQIPQRVAITGHHIARLGPIVRVTPFDEFGRRIVTMMSDKGPLNVIQGITEITPHWTKVQGLAGKQPYIWDMRLATSSIPRDTLTKIISKVINVKNLNDRLKVVKFFLQAERYEDTQHNLEAVIKEFPGQEELENEVRAVRMLRSRRIVEEVNARRRAGQHQLALGMLQNFPKKDIAGETLQQVKQMLDEYGETQKQGKEIVDAIAANLEAIKDTHTKKRAEPIVKEISTELNINTLDRMADYARLMNAAELSDEQKLSLAVSGWLLGSNHASTNIAVSLSLFEVRNLVQQYLCETVKLKRTAILKSMRSQEGSTPEMVARLIAHMKPPIESPEPEPKKPGFYDLQVPSLDKEPNVTYFVQLPPEYDPYRRYPTLVTLNGAGTTPEQQVDWWAGALDENGSRLGQATRHGYIVIAVDWARADQKEYEFSAREHAAVLASLRDACRRFSIDTDRVYLSGHSMGGDAAWDLALAHPDLWAGVIPIVAVADKYSAFYSENAGLVPFYFVSGELDGDKTVHNARDLDRYLNKHYDVTVVEYQGRGHEHFYDEIQRIFDWMPRRERNFFPKKFTTATMRTWDNYFWWIELSQFPPSSIVEPSNWPPKRNFQAVHVEASIKGNNIYVKTGAEHVTIWLCPELVDFERPVRITIKGQRLNRDPIVQPDLTTLLEDVRTRGERLHPFWVKIDSTSPRADDAALSERR